LTRALTQLLCTATFFWLPPRRFAGLTAIHVLLLVALCEVAINRVAVPLLRPGDGAPPSWHTYLDYAGLFLFYFAGTLAALLLAQRCWNAIGSQGPALPDRAATRSVAESRSRASRRSSVAFALAGLTTVLAAAPLVVDAPAALSLTLEVAFAASVIAIAVAAIGRRRDLGIQFGLPIVAVPRCRS
jgi:hypothetical protein